MTHVTSGIRAIDSGTMIRQQTLLALMTDFCCSTSCCSLRCSELMWRSSRTNRLAHLLASASSAAADWCSLLTFVICEFDHPRNRSLEIGRDGWKNYTHYLFSQSTRNFRFHLERKAVSWKTGDTQMFRCSLQGNYENGLVTRMKISITSSYTAVCSSFPTSDWKIDSWTLHAICRLSFIYLS